jgi:dynein heavy chain
MVYFLRTVEGKHVVSVDVAQDTSVLYAEVKGNVTLHLANMLRNSTGPMCSTLGLKDTKAQPEHLSDFMVALDRLAQELEETVAAVSHTVDLTMPNAEIMGTRDKLTELAAATRGKKLRDFEELVAKCTTVLMAWCESVETYVTAEREQPPSPFAEVEYWRCRLSALTSIANQLQTKKARYIHQVLLKSNDSGDAIHAWKAVDLKLTEATNAAKDNLKYLLTLERYIKPLRSRDPKQMIEAMPGLFNAIKMIFTIARYYGTGQAMTTLLTSIATEVITQSCEHLVQRNANSWLWEDDPSKLVGRLNDCQDIKHAFEVSFRDTKDAINDLPHGRPLDVDELAIFGKLQLFGRRIAKLTELFTTVRQFTSLKTSKIDDIEAVVEKFATTVGMLTKKQSDVLEYTASSFDRDYVQFKSQVEKLDKYTLDFIDKTFEDVGGSITKSLDVLVHYQRVFEREVIRSALDKKFVALFYSYGEELEEITALYERERHAPPIARNLPPVAGNIQWSKLLLERAEAPMQRFDKEKSLSGDRNYKRIIKSYNKLVRTLVAFEILWFQAWCQAIDKAKSGLSATLIVRHPDDENLYVNFDARVPTDS